MLAEDNKMRKELVIEGDVFTCVPSHDVVQDREKNNEPESTYRGCHPMILCV